MSQRYTLSQYSAAEAEQVSGIGVAMQRDWRRRGFLPAHPGQARFHLFSLAELCAFALLTGRGIGPTQVQSVVEDTAWGIAYFALDWPDAYHGPAVRPEPSLNWDEVANIHRVKVLGAHSKLPGALRYLIWWADDTHAYTDSLDAAFDATTSADPRVQAGIVVLDLQAAGSNLAGRAVRPLVHVDVAPAPSPLDQPGLVPSERAGRNWLRPPPRQYHCHHAARQGSDGEGVGRPGTGQDSKLSSLHREHQRIKTTES